MLRPLRVSSKTTSESWSVASAQSSDERSLLLFSSLRFPFFFRFFFAQSAGGFFEILHIVLVIQR